MCTGLLCECLEGCGVACTDNYLIVTSIAGTRWVHIQDKFGNIFSKQVAVGAGGRVPILQSDFPDLSFNPHAGVFKVWVTTTQVIDNGIEVLKTVDGQPYYCINISFKQITPIPTSYDISV